MDKHNNSQSTLSENNEEVRHFCEKCGRSYRNKKHLKRHVQLECDRKKQFQCSLCQKEFYRKEYLHNHMRLIHTQLGLMLRTLKFPTT